MIRPPRRILYTQVPTGGGSTISLYELVKGLDKTRYVPVVLFLRKNKYLEQFNRIGIKTLTLPDNRYRKARKSFIRNLFQFLTRDIPLALQIARLIQQEEIELIHHNLGFNRVIMMASAMSRTLHVCHFRNFNKKIPFIVKALARFVDASLYTTQAVADCYRSLGGAAARQAIVYEPIDLQRFAEPQDAGLIRREFSVADNGYVISNVGRVTPWKGQHYFLQAMTEIVVQYPNITILIVGEPGTHPEDQAYFDLLQDLARQGPLQGRVLFTGNRNDVAAIMAASDIVVHSASEPEPFGLVIAEAMAVGTPVIATQGGGTPEIIEDGVTGLLVPMKNADGIREAIQKLLASDTLRETIGRNARSEVRRFSIERHVAKVQKMYEAVFEAVKPAGGKG